MRRQDQRRERKNFSRKNRLKGPNSRVSKSPSKNYVLRAKLLPDAEVVFDPHISSNRELFEIVKKAWFVAYSRVTLDIECVRNLKKARLEGFGVPTEKAFIALTLGQKLQDEVSKLVSPTKLRTFDVEVVPRNKPEAVIELRIRELLTVDESTMQSPLKPKVTIDSTECLVGFNFNKDDHFIRRIEERTVVSPTDYRCKGQAFNCLWNWQYFELIDLPNGQPAVRLWNTCDPTIQLSRLWKEMLPADIKIQSYGPLKFYYADGAFAYYLVGYCPIDCKKIGSEEFAILKTLLIPGMRNTPEGSMLRKGKSQQEVSSFDAWLGKQTLAELAKTGDYSLTRMCHQVEPQVKLISTRVFSCFPSPPSHR